MKQLHRWLWVALLALGVTARAAEGVPVNLSLLVMLKVLTYDQTLPTRGEGEFVVLIPHNAAQSQALSETLSAISAMPQTRIQTREIRFVPVDTAGLSASAKDKKPSALLLLPGTTDDELSHAADLAKGAHLYTLALDPAYVHKDAALGVVNNDGHPQIVINLKTAKDLGIALPVSVLKIARTY